MTTDVCVITGATSGIGKATAIQLAERGRGVVAIGRRADALRELEAVSTNIHGHRMDLREPDQIRAFSNVLLQKSLRPNGLVHSAGIYSSAPFHRTPIQSVEEMFKVNVLGPYLLTQVLLDSLKQARGCVVFFNSSAGMTARANGTGYSATKFALRAVADGLREEVNESGVRVLSIYPGRTATPGMARQFESESRTYRPELLLQPTDLAALVDYALNTPDHIELTDIMLRPSVKSY